MRVVVGLFTGVLAAAAVGCGGSGGGGGSCSPTLTAALTISSTGVTPTNVCVQPGGVVTITNSDTAQHEIDFQGAGCPASVQIAASGSGTATFDSSGNCSYQINGQNASSFKGTVAVTSVTVSGGY